MYRNLVEKACDGIAIIQDLMLIYVNPHLAAMIGYSEEYFIHKSFTDFIHPDELPKVVDRHKRRLAGEEVPSIYESAIKAKDGRKVLVEFNVSQNVYLGKSTTFVFVRDITERKKEEKIQASIYRISEAAYSAGDLPEFYQTIHKIIADLMPAKDNFYISLYDENTNMLHFPYFVDEEEENPDPQELGKGLTEYVFRTGRSLLASPKVFAELEKKGEVISIGPPSIDWLGVPLKIGGKTIGVLTVQSYTEGVRYTEEEKNILTFIAEQIAMAIERKQATQVLTKSEKQIRTLIEAIPASIYFKDIEGKNLVVNRAFEELVGKKREEIIGKTDDELIPKKLADQCHKSDDKIFKTGKIYHGEEKHLRQNGEMCYFETIKSPIPDEFGEIVGLVGVSHDITERKKTEEALATSQERYRDLVEKAGIAILLDDKGGNFQYLNERYARLFGYSVEEMGKKSIRDVVFADDLDMVMRYHKNRVQGKEAPSRYEFRGIKKDRSLIYLEINAEARKRGKKIVGTRCYIWDITARKKAEKALSHSEEKYKTIAENIDVGIYRTSSGVDGRFIEANPAIVKMFGFNDKQEFLNVDVSKLYHDPKGRKSFQKKMLQDGFVKNEEVLLKKKDGTPFLGSVCAVVVRDEKGKIRYFDGIVEDITERKEAEEKLKTSLVEKEVLLREIHHRVKNNLQIISSLLNLQSRHIEDEPALDMFQESRNRVRSMALVHEKLYRSEDLAKVDFCEYIRSLGRHLFMSYGIHSAAIDLDVTVKDVFLDINTSIPCGLIINELISNSLKHAFLGREKGKIRVALRSEKKGKYKLMVSDDGVGLPKGLDVTETESLGLQLVNMLVEQLQGTLIVDNNKGTSFEIVFEKLDYRARH
ncbi:MAG: PAS domain S-box protein [Candidatus Aminicenantes bacterium]|nr:MAG: PAS domain S-box protein [Candidatus Aminicenantes bacterium]